jgi:predicted CxxxxCH...CXXCH cytochrome family protein
VVPDRWDAPGHIVDDVPPAEVTFGARANMTLAAADRMGPPTFANGSCSNVYCHGDVLHAPGGLSTRPVWSTPSPTGTCVRCHASPPPSHARTDCATCHPASAPHIDGVLQIGTSAGCSGCHCDASSPAPNTGAHRVHLAVPSGLRDPIPCSTCHVVPATVDAPGHLDPAPADVLAGACTACHGSSPPAWTQTNVVACGTCHAVPPPTTIHATATSLATCTTCHPYGPSTHMNGVVDAQ